MRPYQDLQTGIWSGLPAVKTKRELILCKLHDDDGNAYPTFLEVDVDDFEVTVRSVNCSTDKELNNPHEDITNAIRSEGHKNQVINFEYKI